MRTLENSNGFSKFTPHHQHDWDAAQIPVLLDAEFRGEERRLMLWSNPMPFIMCWDAKWANSS